MSARPPVNDWLHDFDHQAAQWIEDPYPIWDAIRSSGCPIAHTSRYNGVHLPTRYQDVRDIAYDPARFSSRRVVIREEYPLEASAPPITSDPPHHRAARMVLLPAFTPKAIDKLEGKARALCDELIDAMLEKHRRGEPVDAAVDYAQHIPVRIIAHMLGLPAEAGDLFRRWIHLTLVEGISDPQALLRGFGEMTAYFKEVVDERRRNPGDDLVSYLLDAEFDGTRFDEDHVIGTLRLLLIAGIDTTWSGLGASLWHLATHPQDRQRMVEDPGLMPTAIEEFLRAYAPVTMARVVKEDTELNGCPMKAGEGILLSFPAANRDPAMFPDADKVLIDRKENRHAAFGLGIHRCIGSNLARMEMTVAVEQWLKRIPQFELDTSRPTTWSVGTVRGPRLLPVKIG
jgi:cytochrome P450